MGWVLSRCAHHHIKESLTAIRIKERRKCIVFARCNRNGLVLPRLAGVLGKENEWFALASERPSVIPITVASYQSIDIVLSTWRHTYCQTTAYHKGHGQLLFRPRHTHIVRNIDVCPHTTFLSSHHVHPRRRTWLQLMVIAYSPQGARETCSAVRGDKETIAILVIVLAATSCRNEIAICGINANGINTAGDTLASCPRVTSVNTLPQPRATTHINHIFIHRIHLYTINRASKGMLRRTRCPRMTMVRGLEHHTGFCATIQRRTIRQSHRNAEYTHLRILALQLATIVHISSIGTNTAPDMLFAICHGCIYL